jgi:hypothetical protein
MGAGDRPLTLADVKITARVVLSPWDAGSTQEVNTAELAMLLRRHGGLYDLWCDLRGFVEILNVITDYDDPRPEMLGQIRSVAAGLRGILNEINPTEVPGDQYAKECRVTILRRAEEPSAPEPAPAADSTGRCLRAVKPPAPAGGA